MKLLRNELSLAVIVWALASTASMAQPSSQILFSVGDRTTTAAEFIYLFQKNRQNAKGEATEKEVREHLELVVAFKLKIAEAYRMKLDTTAKFRKEFSEYRSQLRRSFLTSDDQINQLARETYERMQWDVRASHILIKIPEQGSAADTLSAYRKIESLRQRALQGESFALLAKNFSEDPSAKANQGDLGYFTALQMVYPFEKAAYSIKVGEISPIIRTQYGYHILRLADRQPAKGEIDVAHIFVQKQKNDAAAAEEKISRAKSALNSGKPWNDVCREFSEDLKTKKDGGKLPTLGVNILSILPSFGKTAFALEKEGQISDTIASNMGWHIIKLIKKTPVGKYEDVEELVKKRVSQDEWLKIAEAKTLKQKKIKYGFKEYEPMKSYFLSLADSSLGQGQWKYKGESQKLQQPIFDLQGKPTLAKEFLRFILERQSLGLGSPMEYMENLYEKFVAEKIGDIEEIALLKTNPNFKRLLNEYKEGILLFDIMEQEVWNKASKDTVGQLKYYQTHLDAYRVGERIEARIITTSSAQVMERIKQKIAAGDSITRRDVEDFTSITPFKLYERGENKAVDACPRISGVYYPTTADGQYHLVEIQRLVPAGVKTYQEARSAVFTAWQADIEKRWMDKLHKKYPIKIRPNILQQTIKHLTTNQP